MKVLVACEESQAVTKAFRKRGHEAYSCDILPCSGGHPEWHIQGDVIPLLEQHWDMILAFPPCTYITNAGVKHLHDGVCSKNGKKADISGSKRWIAMFEACIFFKLFLNHDCKKIAVENPIPHKYSLGYIDKKYTQIIQPWMFGHPEKKATCLWLKGLQSLEPTNDVKNIMNKLPKNKKNKKHYLPPSKDRSLLRSKTFEGIANAMSSQWG